MGMRRLLLTLMLCAPAIAAEHPSLTIKPLDLACAKENIRRYDWARKYRDELVTKADARASRFTPKLIEQFIETTTPLSTIFTPCSACRAQGKVWHPQGHWIWSDAKPDELRCEVCATVFPNSTYPESIAVHTTWGTPQTFTFVGGEPFELFTYKTGRPSISGCLRARKVDFMTDACRDLAEAHLLSGDPRYAQAVRLILLRFAAVYPHWLVHSGYGEFADMDPHIAAEKITALPADEMVYPPNKPDRVLHTGYWTAGRATGHGQEGRFVKAMAFAYDATCEAKDAAGKPVYSSAERATIEKDLLRESTVLLFADKLINNKSVNNRTAAAMVGRVLGDRALMDFGTEGFRKTLDEWFLSDSATPESPAYAMMALNGTIDMPLMSRGDRENLFHLPRYAEALQRMVDGLQGDCTFIPYADTAPQRKFDAQLAEILASNYSDQDQYLALLRQLCGKGMKPLRPAAAIYYRWPGIESRDAGPLVLPSFCAPEQRIGHLRTGDDGRESLLVLSASRWGSHHHLDSLNLYYWKNGRELLSDLGYLWDNPLKSMNARTLAHNTVLIDEKNQSTDGRGGDVKFFKTTDHVRVMRAASHPYDAAKRYERTSAIIDHGDGHNYVVDFFTVEGGKTQDFVVHGPNQNYRLQKATTRPAAAPIYDLTHVQTIDAWKFWRIVWQMDERTDFVAWSLPQDGESARLGDGWGQRDSYNTDQGKTIPYIIRRTRGGGTKRFVSVFEAYPSNEPFVLSVSRSAPWGGGAKLEVETRDGRDYIECAPSAFRASSKNRDGKTLWKLSLHE